MYVLYKKAHDIISEVWKYVKRKQSLDEKAAESSAATAAANTRSNYFSYSSLTSGESTTKKEIREMTQAFETRMGHVIPEYLRQYNVLLVGKRRTNEQQVIVRNHVGDVIEKMVGSGSIAAESLNETDNGYELNKEKISKVTFQLSLFLITATNVTNRSRAI